MQKTFNHRNGWMLSSLALTLLAASATAQQYSKLWGKDGERWDPANSRLPDFTNVGYKNGDVPIPDWPVGVKITDFGAVPDDNIDDAQAIIAAIAACPDYHAVLVPKGRFTVAQRIIPQRDHFVLRGEDMHESVLFFPKYLDEMEIQEIGWSDGKARNTGIEHGIIVMDVGTEKSIENLTLEFREQRKGGVWEYLGADPLGFTGNVSNSWVRNVVIRNYDLGMKVTRASNLSVINVTLDQFIGRKAVVGSAPKGPLGTVPLDEYGETMKIAGFDALFGIIPRAVNNSLFHNITIKGYVMQPIDMNEFPRNNVFSKIRAKLRAVGYHGGGSEYNLYTDMNHFVSGVGGNRRTHETYWGVDYPLPEKAHGSTDSHIFVGYGDNWPEKITDTIWYEPIDPAQLSPRNLYLAQLQRLGKPLPPPPPPAPSPYKGDVLRILPTEDGTPGKEPNNTALPISGAYLKFDLTGIDVPAIAHARLRIHLKQVRSTPFELSAYAVTNDAWSENGLTSENLPELGAKLDAVRIEEGEDNRVLEFNVTPFVREQLIGGDGVISFSTQKTDGNGNVVFFHSLEGGARPELIIERVPSSVHGAPSAPKGIRSTPLVGNIILNWDDNPESDVATYNVYRDPVNVPPDLTRLRSGYAESYASGLVTSDFVDVQSSGNWKVGMMDHRLVYRYKITAVDDHGYESPRSHVFVAATKHPDNAPPSFKETASLPNATAGVDYSATLASEASDPESDPLYFMKVSGPNWLQVALDGTLSGNPGTGDAGINSFTFQVTAIGGSTLKEVNIEVAPPVAQSRLSAEALAVGGPRLRPDGDMRPAPQITARTPTNRRLQRCKPHSRREWATANL